MVKVGIKTNVASLVPHLGSRRVAHDLPHSFHRFESAPVAPQNAARATWSAAICARQERVVRYADRQCAFGIFNPTNNFLEAIASG